MTSRRENNKSKESFVKLYVPELKQLVNSGDEKMCLLMAQLEYWFGLKPDGFYKFMEVPKGVSPAYQKGDSWVEEMGMSKDKINNGLKSICTQYKSFSDYKKETDKFKGRFYCSYYHKPSHQTFYFRNHDKTNQALASSNLENKSSIFRAKYSSVLGKQPYSVSGNGETSIPEVLDADVVYTENTQENNQCTTQEREHSLFEQAIKNQTIEESEVLDGIVDDSDFAENNGFVKNVSIDWMSAKSIAVPFPANFELTDNMIAWAKEKNPDIDVERATEKFKIHFENAQKKDWLNTWKKWILDEKPAFQNGSGSTKFDQMEKFRKAAISYSDETNENTGFNNMFNELFGGNNKNKSGNSQVDVYRATIGMFDNEEEDLISFDD